MNTRPLWFTLFSFFLCQWGSMAATKNWNNAAGGNWNTGSNWAPAGVPGAGDTVNLNLAGTYQVVLDINASVAVLTVGGAAGTQKLSIAGNTLTITGSATVATGDELLMTDGTLAGPGTLTVQAGGVLNFDGVQQKTLFKLTLLNQGTVNWKHGTLADGDFAVPTVITNSSLWVLSSDDQLGRFFGGASAMRFVNTASGTVRKTAAAGISTFYNLHFVNAGLLESLSGVIRWNGIGSFPLGGTFNAAAAAALELYSGGFNDAGGVFNGPGVNRMVGGTLVLRTNLHSGLLLAGGTVKPEPPFQNAGAITNLTLSGATLANTNRVKGTLNVAAESTLSDQLTVEAGGVLNFDGVQQKTLFKLTLLNQGTVNWKHGTLADGDFAVPTVITNSSLWVLSSDDQLGRFFGGPSGMRFVNTASGTVRKTAAAGISTFYNLHFVNAGLLESLSGVIRWNGIGSFPLGGTFNAAAAAALELYSGGFNDAGGVFNGAGVNRMVGGTLVLRTNLHSGLLLAGGTVKPEPPFQNAGAITNLTLSGATLANTNRVKGTLNVAAESTLSDQLTVEAGGVLNFDGVQQKTLFKLTLLNQGTVNWKHGTLADGDFAVPTVITNSSLWVLSSDDQLGRFFGGASAMRFVNTASGTVRKTAAAGISTFYNLHFVNAGLLESLSGVIRWNGIGSFPLGGTFNAAAAAALELYSGGFNDAGGVFNGPGVNRMVGGTLVLRTNLHSGLLLAGGTVKPEPPFQNAGAITNLTLSGATLANTNRVKGTLNVAAESTLSDQLTVEAGGVLNFDGVQQKTLFKLTLLNQGTVNWKHGTLADGDFAVPTVITNSSLWVLSSDDQLGRFFGGPSGMRFVNTASGTVRKTAAAGISTFYNLHFVNAGLLESLSGVIRWNGIGSFPLGGTFNAAAAAALELYSGNFSDSAGVFTGAGVNRMVGGTLVLRTNLHSGLLLAGGTVKPEPPFQNAGAITNLTLSGATLANTNRVKGTLNVAAESTLSDQLTVEAGGVLNFDGVQQKTLFKLVLLNQGTVNWKHGTLADGDFAVPTVITNSSLWVLSSDDQLGRFFGGPSGMRFVNTASGILRKTAGTGISTFYNLHFANAGLVEIQQGTIRLPAAHTLNAGVLRPIEATLDSQGTLTVSGGILEGRGNIGANSFTGGTVRPGINNGYGILRFTDGLNLTAPATVWLNANGLTPGTQHDQFKVTGAVNLNGATLQLTEILNVPPGQTLLVIENDGADAVAGTFKNLPENSVITVNGAGYKIHYSAGTGNDVTLVREGTGTGIKLVPIALLPNNTFHFQGNGVALGTYNIEATTNFVNWANLGNVQANAAGLIDVIDVNAPSFPYRFYRAFGP